MKITAENFPVTVQYKLAGKFYNQGNDVTAGIAFEEICLLTGQSFELHGELINIRNDTPVADAPVVEAPAVDDPLVVIS